VSSVIKVILLLKFRADLDKEHVRHWWLTEHAELALRNLGMKRYVQNHWVAPIAAEHAAGGMPYDGCVEVWFEDREAYEATMASPEWKALEEDGPNGFDMEVLHGGFVNEHVMRWDALPDGRVYTSAGEIPR
jgi:uncharacterized protein (TIGR02118 family)